MNGLNQLAWVADAIKSPLASPHPTRSASLAVLADELSSPPSDPPPSGPPTNAPTIEASRPAPRRRYMTRAADRYGVSGLLSAEDYARALVLVHLSSHSVELEKSIRAACPGRDSSEQLRVLVEEGAVARYGYGINRDPYTYTLVPKGAEMVESAREALAVDAAAQEELSRVTAKFSRHRKPAKPVAVRAENAEDVWEPRAKRKRKVTEALKEYSWSDEEEENQPPQQAVAPAPRRAYNGGLTAIQRALDRIKSHKRTARAPAPPPSEVAGRARVRALDPPPADAAFSWERHWSRTWGSYGAAPKRERRAVGDILVSIADAVGGPAVTGAELRRIFPGCPDHSKALTAVINAGWVTRTGVGGRNDPYRYTATAAGVEAAAVARNSLAADNAGRR